MKVSTSLKALRSLRTKIVKHQLAARNASRASTKVRHLKEALRLIKVLRLSVWLAGDIARTILDLSTLVRGI